MVERWCAITAQGMRMARELSPRVCIDPRCEHTCIPCAHMRLYVHVPRCGVYPTCNMQRIPTAVVYTKCTRGICGIKH